MKAISLWQPWASAVALGSKRIETRPWRTKYRGPILIHAAQRKNKSELICYGCYWNWQGALWPFIKDDRRRQPLYKNLPFGALVAVAELVDCRPTDDFTQAELDIPHIPLDVDHADLYAWTERQLGDFSLGRYGRR